MPILNRNKVYVPDATGTDGVEYERLTKIDKESGLFSITVPEHLREIAALVAPEQKREGESSFGSKRYAIPGLNYHDYGKYLGEVVAKDRVTALENWDSLMHRCREWITTQVKVKVILLSTEMNISVFNAEGIWQFSRSDVSFAKTSTVVGVSYKVCFQAGKNLVDENNKYVSRGECKSVIIPYTPEREEFLKGIVDAFKRAAVQLNDFEKIIKEDPLQIDAVISRGFLLGRTPAGEGDVE